MVNPIDFEKLLRELSRTWVGISAIVLMNCQASCLPLTLKEDITSYGKKVGL